MSKLFLLATMVASTTALPPSTKSIYQSCGCAAGETTDCKPTIFKGSKVVTSGVYIPKDGSDGKNLSKKGIAPGDGYFCPFCKGIGEGESVMFNGNVFYEDPETKKFIGVTVKGAADGGCDTNDGKDCTVPAGIGGVLYCPDLSVVLPKGCMGVDLDGTETDVTTQETVFFPITFKGFVGEGNIYHNIPKGSKSGDAKGAFGVWCKGQVCDKACFDKKTAAPKDGTFYRSFYGACEVVKTGGLAPAEGLFIPEGNCDKPVAGTPDAASRIANTVVAAREKLKANGVKAADLPTESYVTDASGKALAKDGTVAKNQPTSGSTASAAAGMAPMAAALLVAYFQ